jgi:hypothetical protein
VAIVLLAVGALAAPYFCRASTSSKKDKAFRISKMLVEMSMNLRPTKQEFKMGKDRGVYIVSPSTDGVVESNEKGNRNTPGKPEKKIEQQNNQQHQQHQQQKGKIEGKRILVPLLSNDEIEQGRRLISAVKELGNVAVSSLGVATSLNEVQKEGSTATSADSDSVKIPFPKELLETLEKLETMMKAKNANVIEIEKISEKISMIRNLTNFNNERKAENMSMKVPMSSPKRASLPPGPTMKREKPPIPAPPSLPPRL